QPSVGRRLETYLVGDEPVMRPACLYCREYVVTTVLPSDAGRMVTRLLAEAEYASEEGRVHEMPPRPLHEPLAQLSTSNSSEVPDGVTLPTNSISSLPSTAPVPMKAR